MKGITGFFALSSLKNRLFLAFLLLIFLPYALLQLYNYSQIELALKRQVSRQNMQQLEQLKIRFEDLRSTVFRIAILLEKDPSITDALSGEGGGEEVRTKLLEDKFNEITGRILPSPFVYYALADLHGHVYTSYHPAKPLSEAAFLINPETRELLRGPLTYRWVNAPNDLDASDSKNPRLLTLYSSFAEEGGPPRALLRISIDFQAWLSSMARTFPLLQDFYILDERGRPLAATAEQTFDPASVRPPGSYAYTLQDDEDAYWIEDAYLYNRVDMPTTQWGLISRFPLHLLFGDIEHLKNRTLTTLLLSTVLFVLITFLILSRITRPLRLLQHKMAEIVDRRFNASIPTKSYSGEVLALAQSFNNMAADLRMLVSRLKSEERQKEAVRFQVLLSQMNPHFLLNTLNTVKWNALSRGDEVTADICQSLGRLLETGLNVSADLLHLKEELELVEAYVSIQSYRYERQFQVQIEVEPGLHYALVPKLSLQPLVENAIFHGLAAKQDGTIRIRVYAEGKQCVLEVEDDGVGFGRTQPQAGRKRKGIGLTNVQERLELLFKRDGKLEIQPLAEGTLVRLTFPLLVAAPYEEGGENHVERAAR
ncbi:hypothetical protein J31TS4_18070 [Paenibacillus sp. J31TS4]|uniref:cache domain-containing sensor histidine kinase n=1 Tax=Paenibacillus sp. J31TS4 TaxID=2807195 RepID=UPI001B045CA4|nr:sensor histidine kinase [Paenibacillus sp. J31TS4]GIP38527.1 hypothetical protein J31TS4_18070 [Paenibacillus sp. J31TS4]